MFGLTSYLLPTLAESFPLPATAAEATRFVAERNRLARESRDERDEAIAADRQRLAALAAQARRTSAALPHRRAATPATPTRARVVGINTSEIYAARNRPGRVASARERYGVQPRGDVA